MEKGINLSLTKSLADFDVLLDAAIEAVFAKKLSVIEDYPDSVWKFQVGKYIQIEHEDDDDEEDTPIFWVGYGWEENENRESILWLEFDAATSPPVYWEKINKLVGTSGKYYSEVSSEFAQAYMNKWVHFYLRGEYLRQFYDETADPKAQKSILTGFINEVLEKL